MNKIKEDILNTLKLLDEGILDPDDPENRFRSNYPERKEIKKSEVKSGKVILKNIEEGVAVKYGKEFWTSKGQGYYTDNIEDMEIGDPKYSKNTTDFTSENNKRAIEELKRGKFVKVRKTIIYELI